MATDKKRPTRQQYRVNCKKVLEYATCCVWCGRPISRLLPVGHPLKAVCDHVLSLKRGGTDDIGNLVPSCWSCNARKQAKGPGWQGPKLKRSRDW